MINTAFQRGGMNRLAKVHSIYAGTYVILRQ